MKKQSTTLKVEFENRPPTVDELPELNLKLIARALVRAYKRYKEEEEKENATKRTTD